MKLFMNLGNSDLRVEFHDPAKMDPIFRNKAAYSTQLKALKDAIRKSKCSFTEKGLVIGKLEYPALNEDSPSSIRSVTMPIVSKAIKTIENDMHKSIDAITFIVTSQEDDKNAILDTYGFEPLLRGRLGEGLFPGVMLEFIKLKVKPSDYEVVFNEYSSLLREQDFNDSAILIAQGTPAQSYSLSVFAASKNPGCPQFYAAHADSSTPDSTEIKPLVLFSSEQISKRIDAYSRLLAGGSYQAAIAFLDGNEYLLQRVPGTRQFTEYLLYRSRYLFSKAYAKSEELKELNPGLYAVIGPSLLGLDEFESYTINDGKDPYLDYCNPGFPLLLRETLQNIRFSYEKGDYFLAVAMMTSFLDVLDIAVISRQAGLEHMNFSGKDGYASLNRFMADSVIPYCSRNKYSDIKKNWNVDKGVYTTCGPSTSQLIEWMEEQDDALPGTKALAAFMKLQGRFLEFRKLRNRMPIAHSMGAVEKSIIEATLKNGISFESFLNSFDVVLKAMAPEISFPPAYHEIDSAVNELRKQLKV